MEFGDARASWISDESSSPAIVDELRTFFKHEVETAPPFHAVAHLVWPFTKLIPAIVHPVVEPLDQSVLEIFSDGPRVVAITYVDFLEGRLCDRAAALVGLLEELTPTACRYT